MDWISTYDSSSVVSLELVFKDDNGTKLWLLPATAIVSSPSHHFSISRSSTLIMLSWQIPKNMTDIIYSHMNIGWLCNLRFDYSETFGGFAWLHVILTAPPMPSQQDWKKQLVEKNTHSALIPKSCLWEHKSIKFL